jgi:hypothetical protein
MSEAADDRDEPRAGVVGGHTKGHAAMAAELDSPIAAPSTRPPVALTVPRPDGGQVLDADGGPIWDLSRFEFIAHGGKRPTP